MKKAVLRYVAILIYLLFTFIPIYWILLVSFRSALMWTPGTAVRFEPTVGFTLDNYLALFREPEPGMLTVVKPIYKPLMNSLVISLGSVALALLYGVPAAYVISRYRTGGYYLSTIFLGFRMLPPIVIIVPFFLMYHMLKLFDTHIGMMLFFSLVNVPFVLWLMKSFFDDIPRDVDEAAILDGCNLFQAFYKICLPMAKSGLITVTLFIFLLVWNDFLGVFVLTQDAAFTIPFYLGKVKEHAYGTLYGVIGSVTFISLIPCLILARYLQRHLVRGLTFGAVKGRR